MSRQIIKPFELLLEYEKRSVSHALGSAEEDTDLGDWSGIGFKIGDIHLISQVDDVNEVVILPELVRIPGIDTWVLGLVNIRSNLIPAIDLRFYLTGEPAKLTKHSRMLVINQPGGQAGLVVDEVFGQRHFKQSQWEDVEGENNSKIYSYCDKFFSHDEVIWNVFAMEQLVHDTQFQNASIK
jgi:twitching motility protein PilI